jgi:hypothetical protein
VCQNLPTAKNKNSLTTRKNGFHPWTWICILFTKRTDIMKTFGIVLIAIGVIMTVFTGFNIITEKEVLDVGPLEINREEKTPVYWSPLTGLILAGIGGIVAFAGRKK